MSRRSDVKRLVEQEAEALGFDVEISNGKWKITNPETGRPAFIPMQGVGRSMKNFRTEIRSLRSATPPPMVAATDTERTDTMPRNTWWSIDTLLEGARANGIKPYVSGGILHTPGPIEAQSFADMLHTREEEVIAYLTPTTEGEAHVPTIGESAHITRTTSKDIAADAEALWELLREQARKQGDLILTNGGNPGVQWRGAVSDIIEGACPDWDAGHVKEVRQYLNRTEHTRCHRPHAKPPVWWIATEWNNGNLTVTRIAPKPGPAAAPKPAAPTPAPSPAPAAATLTTGGPALQGLIAFERNLLAAEQRATTAEAERDEARRERDEARRERDDLRVKVNEVRAERDQATAELDAINALFTRINGGAA